MLLAACQPPTKNTDIPHIVDSELISIPLGANEVHGVRLRLSAKEKTDYRAYIITLYQDEKVWIDTLRTEVPANDTIDGEVYFTEAIVDKNKSTEFKIESYSIEQ